MLDSGYVLLNSRTPPPDGGYKAGARNGWDVHDDGSGLSAVTRRKRKNRRIHGTDARSVKKQIVHQGYAIIDRMQAEP